MTQAQARYTTRLQKGGALIEDMRVLVRAWTDEETGTQRDRSVLQNVLAKETRARAADTFLRAYLPRFVHGSPAAAWRVVRPLEDRDLPIEVLRPIYYWVTARSEPLLYDFVRGYLYPAFRRGQESLPVGDAKGWIAVKLATQGVAWSPTVTLKVARGLLAALRDFRVLEGAVKKRIAAPYLPLQAFAYLAFSLHKSGLSPRRILAHADWELFLLPQELTERLALEAHQAKLLTYSAAGNIVRLEFPADTFEGMADVVARRAI